MTTIPKPGSISFADRVVKTPPYEWGFGSTPRVAQLREDLYRKEVVTNSWSEEFMGIGKATFRKNVRLDMDRARLWTRAYRETEGMPMVLRRAYACKLMCEEMPIFIKPGELIVGDPNGSPDEIRWHPENCVEFMPEAVTTGGFSEMVTEEERREICEDIAPYWMDKCMDARIRDMLPDWVLPYLLLDPSQPGSIQDGWNQGRHRVAFDFEKLYPEGIEARIKRVEAKLQELDDKVLEIPPDEFIRHKYNYRAMITCGKAIIRYAQRHAELARELAKEESDPKRKQELQDMAEICERVPAKPPRTLHEALQFFWFIETVVTFFVIVGQGSGARIDQIWWPYYEADILKGRITRDQALELLELLFLKVQEVGSPIDYPFVFTATAGGGIFYLANLCGTKPDGSDASNDLSCLCLEACANLRLNQPAFGVRYHPNISPDVAERIIDCIRVGGGHPALWNESLLEQWALQRGFSSETAKKTSMGGCVANFVIGELYGSTELGVPGAVVGGKMMEYALFQGEDVLLGGQGGRPTTKDPREMQSADELLEAWAEHLLWHTKIAKIGWDVAQQMETEFSPNPSGSFLMDQCIERGEDCHVLNKEIWTNPCFVCMGQVNVADSLAAIDTLVFREKKYTMEDLLTALRANWAGYEEMRQDFLNAPKYGNDDDYADDWALKVKLKLDNTVRQVNDAWGYHFTIDGSSAIGYQMLGFTTAATPDGRRAGEHFADGSRSPMAGADTSGPTATLNSAGKLPFVHTELFNQRFMPQFLEGDNRQLFAEYLREWHSKGSIPHIQFNCVDSGVLRVAQQEPERYSDLQVRVAGYSAFFVDLPLETQDSIISRTEQSIY